jgi:hypothetical protein
MKTESEASTSAEAEKKGTHNTQHTHHPLSLSLSLFHSLCSLCLRVLTAAFSFFRGTGKRREERGKERGGTKEIAKNQKVTQEITEENCHTQKTHSKEVEIETTLYPLSTFNIFCLHQTVLVEQ